MTIFKIGGFATFAVYTNFPEFEDVEATKV
jgi:hypothetical protein